MKTMYTLITGNEFVTKDRNHTEINKVPKKYYNTLDLAQNAALEIASNACNEILQLETELPVLKVKVANAKKRIAKYREQLKNKDNLTVKECRNIEKYLNKAQGEVFFARLNGKSHPRTIDKLKKLSNVKTAKVTFEVP
jgi:hypothetical protein